MPVALGARTEHGFDQPLGLMADCHRRIEHFLGILVRVTEDCRGEALTDEHRRAVEASLKYFDAAAPRHTEDEEQSLFPRLRGLDPDRVREATRKLTELEADHGVGNTLYARSRSAFQQWLDLGSLPELQAKELADALAALRELYGRHIAVEEREIFPLAGEVLSQDQLRQLGREMAERRGLTPVEPTGTTSHERPIRTV